MKIVLIGTGNVATQLGMAFRKANHQILQVYGRNNAHAKTLAGKLKATATSDLTKINLLADVYIIAVTDSAIKQILKKLKLTNQLIVHTSGCVPLGVFGNRFSNFGVLYPVQSVSKNISAGFSSTPFCIEAGNNATKVKLTKLAKSISEKIYYLDSEQRSMLHLAAVFVNNFSNHLYYIGEKILAKNQLSFDLLKPIIAETVSKISNQSPGSVQTGPAIRKDKGTIEMHLKMLKKHPAYKQVYKTITKSIQQTK